MWGLGTSFGTCGLPRLAGRPELTNIELRHLPIALEATATCLFGDSIHHNGSEKERAVDIGRDISGLSQELSGELAYFVGLFASKRQHRKSLLCSRFDSEAHNGH